ncbi:MAG: serine/threonine protein kinase [Planctomycetota bacterium]|nr:MAG: serine/threonine protein kinase [Planctomycetota bacterium]
MNSTNENEPQDASGAEERAAWVGDPDLGETVAAGPETHGSQNRGAQPDTDQWVGQTLGKYEIVQILGMGGMGVVFKAHDPTIDRDVAIKLLASDLSSDATALNRFLAEARSAGKLNHANAVTIHEVAEAEGAHYLVMEIVSGGSAADHLEEKGAYAVADATKMVIEACQGLAAAHRVGLIHRDVKPANLLLTEDGTVKVSDFGLAKQTRSQTLQMTRAGQVVGTPYYMSPEQCESRDVDARSDVYSLGATYYSLLTGRSPYEDSGSLVQVMFAHCNAERPDPREVNSKVPPACAAIINRAMAIKPDDRYQSIDEMRTDLEAVLGSMSGAGITLPSQSGVRFSPLAGSQTTNSPTWNRSAVRAIAAASVLLLVAGFFAIRNGLRNDNSPETTGEDAPAIAAPLEGEPIKVGILHSLSGTMAGNETSVADAALLAVEQINENGGLLGRPVEAVVADGRSNSETFARETRRLIEQENVCTVFGCWTSADRKTVVPIFEELDHLLVYPVQYEGIEESPNVVYTGAAPNQQIIPAVKWAYAFDDRRRFFLVGSDYVFPRVAHEIIKDQLTELGAELVGEEFLPLGSDRVGPIVEAIQAAQPDVILNSINGDSNEAFFAALREAGITSDTVPTISFSIGEEELKRLDASAMVGDYAAWNYFESIDSPENAEFVAALREKYGPGYRVSDPMESAWFGVKLWAQAVESAGSVDPSVIRHEMRNQRMVSPGGAVRIDPATQHTFKTPRIGRVQADGQFEIVWTAAKPEPPQPYPASRSTADWKAYLHDLYTGWGNRWAAPHYE